MFNDPNNSSAKFDKSAKLVFHHALGIREAKVLSLFFSYLAQCDTRADRESSMKMLIKISFLIFLVYLTSSSEAKYKNRCSTLSCVHSSATIIQKLDTEIDPCDDFYAYACGTFLEEQHTPDEKTTVDTLALMSDKLTEYLLTLLLQPSQESEKGLHMLAKKLFNSCFNFSKS